MLVCVNCGSVGTVDEIRAKHPGAMSCCPERRVTEMNEYEKAIREKVHAAGILSPGEWVYLVGCLVAAAEKSETD